MKIGDFVYYRRF
jgi:hypothetical protein